MEVRLYWQPLCSYLLYFLSFGSNPNATPPGEQYSSIKKKALIIDGDRHSTFQKQGSQKPSATAGKIKVQNPRTKVWSWLNNHCFTAEKSSSVLTTSKQSPAHGLHRVMWMYVHPYMVRMHERVWNTSNNLQTDTSISNLLIQRKQNLLLPQHTCNKLRHSSQILRWVTARSTYWPEWVTAPWPVHLLVGNNWSV